MKRFLYFNAAYIFGRDCPATVAKDFAINYTNHFVTNSKAITKFDSDQGHLEADKSDTFRSFDRRHEEKLYSNVYSFKEYETLKIRSLSIVTARH